MIGEAFDSVAIVPMRDGSGDDVGNVAVEDQLDFVLEPELALLEPGDLQLVGLAVLLAGGDFLVEAAVLGLERLQLLRDVLIHLPASVAQRAAAVTNRATRDKPLEAGAEPHGIARQERQIVIYWPMLSLVFTKGMAPMDKAHVEELASKHAALDALIDEEEHRPLPDIIRLHELKKEKLRLKDQLAGHYTH